MSVARARPTLPYLIIGKCSGLRASEHTKYNINAVAIDKVTGVSG